MGDSRRFDLFAKLIFANFPPDKFPKVADIAGGKGYLQIALRRFGYNVTTFDKRKGKRNRPKRFQYQYRYFSDNIRDTFDLLVCMHPDEATDVIIVEATKQRIPFIVCPCCIKPNAVAWFGIYKYHNWLEHLESLATEFGYMVTRTVLRMNGKSICLIGRSNRLGGLHD